MRDNAGTKIRLHTRFIKSYKKNTLAVFFSFTLTFMLLAAMLVLLHTNHRVMNLQGKAVFSPADCYIQGLTQQKLSRLREDKEIKKIAVQQGKYHIYEQNSQSLFLAKADDEFITMMSKVIEGRMPEKEGEVTAEKWILLNLGVEPVINQKFTILDPDTKEEKELKLVGIMSDMLGNKRYGLLNLYTSMDTWTDDQYLAYLRFQDDVNYEKKITRLKAELDLADKQIKECPARENLRELYETDVQVVSIILLICVVMFYGIYRIASITREKQYGILRAVGMKRRQLKKMILLEIYQIYAVSVPAGIGAGLLLAHFIIAISGDADIDIYLFNEKIRCTPVIPFWHILISVMIMGVLVGIVGYMAGRRAVRASVIETISGNLPDNKAAKSNFNISRTKSRTGTLLHMGGKYIVRDKKTSCFVVLTICLGVTLFTGLAYRAQILHIYRSDTKEMWYLNGEYAMSMLYLNDVGQGMARQSVAEIEDIEEVTSVKTASGMPVRVIDENNTIRNEAYYDKMNHNLKEIYGYEDAGRDGKNQVYKSVLYGYNENALKELKKYIISGDFDPGSIDGDEIILSVLSMDDKGDNEIPGSYKEGVPLMQYKAGEKLRIKYRADFDTRSQEYENFKDVEEEYVYKTYKIAAVVSFPYMYDCNRTIYPLMITSDRQLQNIAPGSSIQNMYVDGKDGLSLQQQLKLERKLIKICSRYSDISTRSLITEIRDNEMFYRKQMVYITSIAIVAFILVIINMLNNLRYRMQTRSKEICMLRAIGMSVAMTKKMLFFENIILGLAGVITAFLLLHPVLRYLYSISDMEAYGHSFQYSYAAFAAISASALLICGLLSLGILKSWKTRQITEGIGKVE